MVFVVKLFPLRSSGVLGELWLVVVADASQVGLLRGSAHCAHSAPKELPHNKPTWEASATTTSYNSPRTPDERSGNNLTTNTTTKQLNNQLTIELQHVGMSSIKKNIVILEMLIVSSINQ